MTNPTINAVDLREHTKGPWVLFQDPDDRFANARLIAAAPDLLEALKDCALQIAQTHNRKLTASEQTALDAARAAIAKAEGRDK